MRAAVILSTYNQPRWLEKTLLGYAAQTERAFDLIVADDGSDQETTDLVARVAAEAALPIRHVWQEHHGFRKCEILNRAVITCDAEYIIFSDGDCIPRSDFVATHLRLAERGRFLCGGTVSLPRETCERITADDIRDGNIANPRWLRRNGWHGSPRSMRLIQSPRLAALADAITPTSSMFDGHNSSGWRTDFIAVNGFDAEMEFGGRDRALGQRLSNLGVRGKQVKHRAICFWLHQERHYRDSALREHDRAVRSRIRAGHKTWARVGIAELPPDRPTQYEVV
jgi:glycosyltransferase involved in cell wall biosynthesis